MEEKVNDLVKRLIKLNETVATMESCTGGGVCNQITNVLGASEILKFSAVTYSNEYKIKMGVDSNIIDKYTVYSKETAVEMSHKISDFANSDFGIGVTGKLNRSDSSNPYGSDNMVFVNVYDRKKNLDYTISIEAIYEERCENKLLVIDKIMDLMLEIVK